MEHLLEWEWEWELCLSMAQVGWRKDLAFLRKEQLSLLRRNVWELAYSYDAESYVGGNTVTGRVCYAGQVKGDEEDKKYTLKIEI
jgi:hypothetical protein